jgi:hypothetical protein
MKTKLVSLIVAGLASKMPIVKCLCALSIQEVQAFMQVTSVSEVLSAENGYFFNNLFAKLRYFGVGMSAKHIHMTLIALKEQVP